MRLVLLGPPGAGKGTQARRLAEAFGVTHIASGDTFLRNIREETPLGRQAKPYYESGRLVPDELTVGMVMEALREAEGGFVLDGFPRNIAQAHILDRELSAAGRPLQAALAFDLDEETAVKRISGRRICLNDEKHVFNVHFSPPGREGICDICGGRLVQRPDQTEEAVRKRFDVYQNETAPLLELYADRGLLRHVEASGSEDEVAERVRASVGDLIEVVP